MADRDEERVQSRRYLSIMTTLLAIEATHKEATLFKAVEGTSWDDMMKVATMMDTMRKEQQKKYTGESQ